MLIEFADHKGKRTVCEVKHITEDENGFAVVVFEDNSSIHVNEKYEEFLSRVEKHNKIDRLRKWNRETDFGAALVKEMLE